jgi:hypothetical protein
MGLVTSSGFRRYGRMRRGNGIEFPAAVFWQMQHHRAH